MPSILYNKLVRDKISEIIAKSGKQTICEILDDESFKLYLDKKLQEELAEYFLSDNVEELADLVEVIDAILEFRKIDFDEFEKIRKDKNREKGQFKERILLKEVISE